MKKRYYSFTIISLFIAAPLTTYCALIKQEDDPSKFDMSLFTPNTQDADDSSDKIEMQASSVRYNDDGQIISENKISVVKFPDYVRNKLIFAGNKYREDIDNGYIVIKKEDFSVSVFEHRITVSFHARNKRYKTGFLSDDKFYLTLSFFNANKCIDTIQTPIFSISRNTEKNFSFNIERESSSEEGMDRYEVELFHGSKELTNHESSCIPKGRWLYSYVGDNSNGSFTRKLSIICLLLVVSFFFIYKKYFSKKKDEGKIERNQGDKIFVPQIRPFTDANKVKRILKKYNVNIKTPHKKRWKPLHLTTQENPVEVLKALIEGKVNVKMQDKYEFTSLDVNIASWKIKISSTS